MPKNRPKVKPKINKGFIRKIHIQALLFLITYNVLSKTIFIKSITHTDLITNFMFPYMFGVIAGVVFLYLLSHEDFFHFMKEVEDKEKNKEKSFLKKYIHHGKVLATLIIAAIGGPMFAALTIRLILPKYKYKILLLAFGNIASTIVSVSIARGFFSFIFSL